MLPALFWHVFCVCFASKVIVLNMFNIVMNMMYKDDSEDDQPEDLRYLFILLFSLGMLMGTINRFFIHSQKLQCVSLSNFISVILWLTVIISFALFFRIRNSIDSQGIVHQHIVWSQPNPNHVGMETTNV